MSTTLDSLPNEILRHIARLVRFHVTVNSQNGMLISNSQTGNDVRDLRAVNRSVCEAIESLVWEMTPIILNINRDNLGLSMSMLEDFNHGVVEKGKFRRLEIKSLDPSKEAYPPRSRSLVLTDKGDCQVSCPPEPKDTEEIVEARTRIPDILPEALSALTGLRSVK